MYHPVLVQTSSETLCPDPKVMLRHSLQVTACFNYNTYIVSNVQVTAVPLIITVLGIVSVWSRLSVFISALHHVPCKHDEQLPLPEKEFRI